MNQKYLELLFNIFSDEIKLSIYDIDTNNNTNTTTKSSIINPELLINTDISIYKPVEKNKSSYSPHDINNSSENISEFNFIKKLIDVIRTKINEKENEAI